MRFKPKKNHLTNLWIPVEFLRVLNNTPDKKKNKITTKILSFRVNRSAQNRYCCVGDAIPLKCFVQNFIYVTNITLASPNILFVVLLFHSSSFSKLWKKFIEFSKNLYYSKSIKYIYYRYKLNFMIENVKCKCWSN